MRIPRLCNIGGASDFHGWCREKESDVTYSETPEQQFFSWVFEELGAPYDAIQAIQSTDPNYSNLFSLGSPDVVQKMLGKKYDRSEVYEGPPYSAFIFFDVEMRMLRLVTCDETWDSGMDEAYDNSEAAQLWEAAAEDPPASIPGWNALREALYSCRQKKKSCSRIMHISCYAVEKDGKRSLSIILWVETGIVNPKSMGRKFDSSTFSWITFEASHFGDW